MDYSNNTKTNDADINDFLYSGGADGGGASNFSLPADPGSSTGYMRQPMNRPDSASQNPLGGAANAD